jgi:hypothetical protein
MGVVNKIEISGFVLSGLVFLAVLIGVVKFLSEFHVGLLIHIQIEVQGGEDVQFVAMQLGHVDSSCELEGLVVVVSVVLEFGGQQQTGQQNLMHVVEVEIEIVVVQVVAVQVDDGDDQTLLGEVSEAVDATQEVSDGEVDGDGGVENGFAGGVLLADEVGQQLVD